MDSKVFDSNIPHILRPRPLATSSGHLLLLPLLPHRPVLKPLPPEVWFDIFTFVLSAEFAHSNEERLSYLLVCRSFKEIILPIYYSHVVLFTPSSLSKFAAHIRAADQKWDSIRRIPYSTPGRWIQSLDLSHSPVLSQTSALELDTILTHLFPLVPFLAHLVLNSTYMLSRRAWMALATREGAVNLRSIEGIGYISPAGSSLEDDALVQLLRCTPNLEFLEVIGPGADLTEVDFVATGNETEIVPPSSFIPPHLPRLRTLTLLSMPSSPLFLALLHTPLPGLRKLTITPYADIPPPLSLIDPFLTTHGPSLRSLLLFTPKAWPTRLHPTPPTILALAPRLRHLALESPLPALLPPLASASTPAPLQILALPRPTPEFWRVLDGLLACRALPALRAVRARDVRWLRQGMTTRALEAGVQGEMRAWRRRLGRRGIRMLDADWKEES